jgi:hypothetical protein
MFFKKQNQTKKNATINVVSVKDSYTRMISVIDFYFRVDVVIAGTVTFAVVLLLACTAIVSAFVWQVARFER